MRATRSRCLIFTLLGLVAATVQSAPSLDQLTLQKRFHISLYADHLSDAREIALGEKGTVFVGSSNAGRVYALTDSQHLGIADRTRVIATGLEPPIGAAFKDGDLYVSTVSRIVVLRDIDNHLDAPPKPEVIIDRLPTETHHGDKFIAFGPDGKLYVPIGAPCNVCEPGPDHGKLTRMNDDGSGMENVARGIRNSVGFDWQPGTGQLWFTDNGRDLLGDDVLSDELNRITRSDEDFGFPYCHQGDTLDPDFGKGKRCSNYSPPVLKLGAQVAALGMRFYDGSQFPAAYQGAIIVAEHGSWNRSKKSAYRVMMVRSQGSTIVAYEPLITGFMQNEQAWGRPVDVQPLPDGSVLLSDDLADAVDRITYQR